MPIAITIPGAAYPTLAILKIIEIDFLNNRLAKANNNANIAIRKPPINPNFTVLKRAINISEFL